jgi:hypothetical protein
VNHPTFAHIFAARAKMKGSGPKDTHITMFSRDTLEFIAGAVCTAAGVFIGAFAEGQWAGVQAARLRRAHKVELEELRIKHANALEAERCRVADEQDAEADKTIKAIFAEMRKTEEERRAEEVRDLAAWREYTESRPEEEILRQFREAPFEERDRIMRLMDRVSKIEGRVLAASSSAPSRK